MQNYIISVVNRNNHQYELNGNKLTVDDKEYLVKKVFENSLFSIDDELLYKMFGSKMRDPEYLDKLKKENNFIKSWHTYAIIYEIKRAN